MREPREEEDNSSKKNVLDHGRSIEFYQRIVGDDPSDYEAWNRLAIANMMVGQRMMAIECWKRSLELSSNQVDVLNNLGSALLEEGLIDEAVDYYRNAVDISPYYVLAWKNLGETLLTHKKHHEATESILNALKIIPGDIELYLLLGKVYYSQSRWQDALKVLENALDVDDSNDTVLYNKACILAKLGHIKETCESLEGAIDLNSQWLEKAKLDPDFDSMRSAGCIQSVLARTR